MKLGPVELWFDWEAPSKAGVYLNCDLFCTKCRLKATLGGRISPRRLSWCCTSYFQKKNPLWMCTNRKLARVVRERRALQAKRQLFTGLANCQIQWWKATVEGLCVWNTSATFLACDTMNVFEQRRSGNVRPQLNDQKNKIHKRRTVLGDVVVEKETNMRSFFFAGGMLLRNCFLWSILRPLQLRNTSP